MRFVTVRPARAVALSSRTMLESLPASPGPTLGRSGSDFVSPRDPRSVRTPAKPQSVSVTPSAVPLQHAVSNHAKNSGRHWPARVAGAHWGNGLAVGDVSDISPSPESFRCQDCQHEGYPYRIVAHGPKSLVYLRCVGCGLEWTLERPASDTASPSSPQ
jgi:hypothetical protein